MFAEDFDDACASAPANLWGFAFWATGERAALAAAAAAWIRDWTGIGWSRDRSEPA